MRRLGFQSTLSVRRATSIVIDGGKRMVISIHALREESDPTTKKLVLAVRFISIHALREESDVVSLLMYSILFIFQSTLSVRRATWRTATIIKLSLFQSTLSVRRATFFSQVECILFDISIHALREESDRI